MWSELQLLAYFMEFTVSWEKSVKMAHKRKKKLNTELAREAEEDRARVRPLEIGWKEFVAKSARRN